ncbi:hypothetical protein [Halomonas heilongjiangensis]|uniref:hypothetical protein n=1 Tax=Halomonas heilongjiangensis TaxID=1387883 RepID=UPI0011AF9B77|nr:hypothetical protein [Halomonas heilongjiangensis]
MSELKINLTKDLIRTSMELKKLYDAIGLLKEARIKCECSLDYCFMLMRRGALGDDVAVNALEYAIKQAALQARLSIMARPRWRKRIEDIQCGRERVKTMRVLTYQALYPFAMKELE